MNQITNKINAWRLGMIIYLLGAIVSFGPIAVTIVDNTPAGPNRDERQGYGVFLAVFLCPAWPLYWSYRIAAKDGR